MSAVGCRGRARYSGDTQDVRITGGPPYHAAESEFPPVRLILIVRTWFAAARRGRLRDGSDVRCPRTPATYGSNGARIARDIVADTSSARGIVRLPPRAAVTATAATRRSRTIASRPRVPPPTATARPWRTPSRRTPSRLPGRS